MAEKPRKRARAGGLAVADGASGNGGKPGQRERLIGSMVALASQRGYHAVSIAEVAAHAGVSSATFYEQFTDKEDCLLAAYQQTTARLLLNVPEAAGSVSWSEASKALLRGLLAALEADADASRLVLVEALAGGPRVRAERAQVIQAFEARARELLGMASHEGKVIDLQPEMLVGAIRSLATQNLRTHREDQLQLMVEDLVAWIESYTLPGDLEPALSGPTMLLPSSVAQRWLAAATPPPPPARLPRGRHGLPAAAVARSQWTRIIHGTADAMVTKGYTAATVADIVAAAGISRDVFYAHFASKHEAYLAAQHYGTEFLYEACAAAYFSGKTFPQRVWLALQALVLAISANPKFTHLRIVECYAAGTAAIEQTEQLKRTAIVFLQEGFTVNAKASQLPRLAAHAITGAVFESFYGRTARGELAELPRQLPLLTYLATAPFIGPRRASSAVEELSAEAVRAAA